VIAELKKYGREDIMVVVEESFLHRIINSYLMPEL
jgi:hypothetical protein